MEWLWHRIDAVLPAELVVADAKTKASARMIVVGCAITCCHGPFFVLFWTTIGPWWVAVTTALLVAATILGAVTQWFTRSPGWATHHMCLAHSALMFVVASVTGGILSPALLFVTPVPGFAGLVTGPRGGVAWSGVLLVAFFGMVGIELAGLEPASVLPAGDVWLYMVALFGVVLPVHGAIVWLTAEEKAHHVARRLESDSRLQVSLGEQVVLQERFERAVAGTSDGLFDADLTRSEVWISEQARTLLGLEDAPLPRVRDLAHRLVHPDDIAMVLRDWVAPTTERGDTRTIECRLRVRGNGFRWFRIRARVALHDGEVCRSSGSISDIDDRMRIETRLAIAVETAGLAMWEYETCLGTARWSDQYWALLGYDDRTRPPTRDVNLDRVHPDDRPSVKAGLHALARGDVPALQIEYRMQRADGSWAWLRGAGRAVGGDDAGVANILGASIDVTNLREATERARAASRAKSEFLANMSHEIRTPMTAILGFIDVLDAELDGDLDQAKSAAKTIRGNAQHLLSVLNDILDMSKIEAGRLSVERIAVNPVAIAEDVVNILKRRAAAKDVAFHLVFDGALPHEITSDPVRLRQVLWNLCGNAVKFTERGSVTLSLSYSDGAMVFGVTDTGIGMTQEQLARVRQFDAFSQADTSTARQFGGSGLGLRISASLARMLGGGLEILSDIGRGSTFTLHVDAGEVREPTTDVGSSPQYAPVEQRRVEPERPLEGRHILLAEDGPDNQRLLSYILERAGSTVFVAQNGAEAVDYLQSDEGTAVDLVLMDVQMPVMDGRAATRQLRQRGFAKPIIALTAHAMENDRRRCLDAGCDEYLTKPIDRKALVEACARFANGGHALVSG